MIDYWKYYLKYYYLIVAGMTAWHTLSLPRGAACFSLLSGSTYPKLGECRGNVIKYKPVRQQSQGHSLSESKTRTLVENKSQPGCPTNNQIPLQ